MSLSGVPSKNDILTTQICLFQIKGTKLIQMFLDRKLIIYFNDYYRLDVKYNTNLMGIHKRATLISDKYQHHSYTP